jgi:hypothetical protein
MIFFQIWKAQERGTPNGMLWSRHYDRSNSTILILRLNTSTATKNKTRLRLSKAFPDVEEELGVFVHV